MQWRARYSIPSLLARADERRVVAVAAAVNGGLAVVTISLFAWLTNLPLVFPALGPTVFILFSAPFAPAAAPRSVILGHMVAMATGLAMWHGMSILAGDAGSLAAGPWQILTASLTLALTALLLVRLACPHPPACASAMVIALGGITDVTGVLLMAGVVVFVTFQARWINRLACLPVPRWAPLGAHTDPDPPDASPS